MKLNPSLSTNGSYDYPLCFTINEYIFWSQTLFSILLLLPLSVTVLILGFQRWRQKRSVSTNMGFSDFFTYNLTVMALIGAAGYIISLCERKPSQPVISLVMILTAFPWNGEMWFPVLTSADRYLAVVHPLTYLRLRQRGGVCIRNICTIFVWIQCFAGVSVIFVNPSFMQFSLILSSCQSALFLVAMIFFSLSVLRILIRPKPGDAAGGRVRVDKSKQRAINTILIIMGVLLLRFGGALVFHGLYSSQSFGARMCWLAQAPGLTSMPSSLVLPLLFLHRAGKLPVCRKNSHSK